MKNRKITHVAYASKHNGGRWIYAHGKQAIKRVCQKALAIRKAELAL